MNTVLRKLKKEHIILIMGIIAALLILRLPLQNGLTEQGRTALSIFAVCIVLWMTRLIPLAATGLLAIALISVTGVMSSSEAFAFFGNSAVFFLLGVFFLSSALIRTGLSKRLTLLFLERFDRTPRYFLTGVLSVSACLSLLMPEHAVAAMIFPILVEIGDQLKLKKGESQFGKAMFLALAWGTVIGGVGTMLGGARAPLAVALIRESYGIRVGFLEWAVASVPLVVLLLPFAYLMLIFGFRIDIKSINHVKAFLQQEVTRIGRMSGEEKRLSWLMLVTIFCWIFFGKHIDLATIAMISGVCIFVFKIALWKDVEEFVNWGVIVMYGGAIALGKSLTETGAVDWLAINLLHLEHMAEPMAVLVLIVLSIILTETISNVATIAVLLPIGFGLVDAGLFSPTLAGFIIALPAGLPFNFPIGTPSNAIAFSSGYYTIQESFKRGILLNIISVIFIYLLYLFYWPLLDL